MLNMRKIIIISSLSLLIGGCVMKPHTGFSSQAPMLQNSNFKSAMGMNYAMSVPPQAKNTESYNYQNENIFHKVTDKPLSTLSTDVDTASYSNIRRFINDDIFPQKGSVRIEEMLNYFSYDYKTPKKKPFAINTKVGKSLWNQKNLILQIGLATKKVNIKKLPATHLVFLLDVSGSMGDKNKLPLLQKSLKLLVKQLRKKDKISIVVYAGASGVILENATGLEKSKIINALDNLKAGGATSGGEGIEVAYKIAQKYFIKKGNNRIILATDGDFNVGQTSQSQLVSLIEKKRKSGIYLTVLGFGMGNYKDSKMEMLSNKGNGNYAYIDNLLEAKKVLVTQMSGTLHTVAKDVKVQVEFNPKLVDSYRLIGYENRVMNAEDFNDDKKDAGEIGMGHSVTALYEIVTTGNATKSKVDKLKYQEQVLSKSGHSNELATVKIRYKKPNSKSSLFLSKVVNRNSDEIEKNDFNFAMSVAGFGMLLLDSKYADRLNYDKVIKVAKDSKGKDDNGYRAEFIQLVEKTQLLKR